MLGSRNGGGKETVGVGDVVADVAGMCVGVTPLGEGAVMFEAPGRPALIASTTPTLPITSAVAAATEVTPVALVTSVTVPTAGKSE
jgi:hypothetical protein